jgi:hypothetical protein
MLIDVGCRRNVNDHPNHHKTTGTTVDTDLVLETGTIIAISHFGKASVNAKWDFLHPKEQHVLDRDELHIMFTSTSNIAEITKHHSSESQRSWKILHDEVVLDSDYGRTLIQFVAQLVENT